MTGGAAGRPPPLASWGRERAGGRGAPHRRGCFCTLCAWGRAHGVAAPAAARPAAAHQQQLAGWAGAGAKRGVGLSRQPGRRCRLPVLEVEDLQKGRDTGAIRQLASRAAPAHGPAPSPLAVLSRGLASMPWTAVPRPPHLEGQDGGEAEDEQEGPEDDDHGPAHRVPGGREKGGRVSRARRAQQRPVLMPASAPHVPTQPPQLPRPSPPPPPPNPNPPLYPSTSASTHL